MVVSYYDDTYSRLVVQTGQEFLLSVIRDYKLAVPHTVLGQKSRS